MAILTCYGLLIEFLEIDGPTVTADNASNASGDHHYTEVTVEKCILEESKDEPKPSNDELKKYIMDR